MFDIPEVRAGERTDLEESSEAFLQESITLALPLTLRMIFDIIGKTLKLRLLKELDH